MNIPRTRENRFLIFALVLFLASLTIYGTKAFYDTLIVGTLNKVIYLDGTKYPLTGAGLASALADLNPTGGRIVLGGDVTVSSPLTLTFGQDQAVDIDGAGHTLTCSVASSTTCLKLLENGAGTFRPWWSMRDLTIVPGNASTSVTGLQVGDSSQCATGCIANMHLYDLDIKNFSTTGSIGASFSNVQDSDGTNVAFNNNATALALNLNTIQNRWNSFHFQGNVNAIVTTDSFEQSFNDCLVQASTGTTPVQITSSTTSVANFRFNACHFEDNGDGTTAGRQILFNAAAGTSITGISITNTAFNGGANVNSGSFNYGVAGSGSFNGVILIKNTYQWTSTNYWSGLANQAIVVAINDPSTTGTVIIPPTMANCTGDGGIGFATAGATKTWAIFGGFPGDFDGSLVIVDCTDNTQVTFPAGSSGHITTDTNIQTLSNKTILTPSIAINSDTAMTAAPRMTWSGTGVCGVTFVCETSARFIPDKPITITRFTVNSITAPAGCTTNFQIAVRDLTIPSNLVTLTYVNGTGVYDSGSISVAATAGHTLAIDNVTAAAGCTTNPGIPAFNVEYKMQ